MSIGRVKIIIASIFLLGLTACSPDIKKIEQPQISDKVKLTKAQSVGQTFTARYDGLDGIEININPKVVNDGKVTLHLKKDPQDANDLATSEIPISKFSRSANYKLKFDPQKHSLNQDYYVSLVMEGDSVLSLGIAAGDAYHNGALYVNDEPLDAQLRFSLIHNRKLVFYGILIEVLGWIKYLAIGIFLFIIPGWALLTLLYDQWRDRYWYEKIGLAAGLSLAIYPILFLWTHIIGLNLGAIYAWAPPILGIGIICWKNYQKLPHIRIKLSSIKQIKLTDVLLLAIMAMIIAVRFWAIRNLPAPMWGDSVQHTVMAKLITDNHGLFESWEPYAPYVTLTVQYGFSVFVALFSWISKLPIEQSTLVVGQLLNSLAVIAIISLTSKVSNKNLWSIITSLIIAGLILPIPATYVNWGRYAQLSGLTILPIFCFTIWNLLQDEKIIFKNILINSILLAGMLLCYYRMAFFVASFLLAWIINIPILKKYRYKYWLIIINGIIIASLSFLLVFPWILNTSGGLLANGVQEGIANNYLLENVIKEYKDWLDINIYLPHGIWIIALICILISIIKSNKPVMTIGLWTIFSGCIVLGKVINFPGTNFMQNFAVIISMYINASILVGYLLGDIILWFQNNHKTLFKCILCILFLISIYSANQQKNISNPNNYSLVTYPDLRAFEWINKNLPMDTKFLIESYLIYEGRSVVGSDAGWWLPLFTHRANTLPPQYALANEKPQKSDYSNLVVNLTHTLENSSISSKETLELFCKWGITHIYIGQNQGQIGLGAKPLFQPKDIPNDWIIYNQDRVFIFDVQNNCKN